jgi:serine/threonine protein kinase
VFGAYEKDQKSFKLLHQIKIAGIIPVFGFESLRKVPAIWMKRADFSLDHVLRHRDPDEHSWYKSSLVLVLCKLLFNICPMYMLRNPNGQTMALINRDIKPENLLVFFLRDIYLSDFGMGMPLVDQALALAQGDNCFLPPWSTYGGGYVGPDGDIYSFGHVLLLSIIWVEQGPLALHKFELALESESEDGIPRLWYVVKKPSHDSRDESSDKQSVLALLPAAQKKLLELGDIPKSDPRLNKVVELVGSIVSQMERLDMISPAELRRSLGDIYGFTKGRK